jgi:L-ascorbate metabolism protein UlaG (beta-lactamase superfamily)
MPKRLKFWLISLGCLIPVVIFPGCTGPAQTAATTPAPVPGIQLQWFGQSTFLLTSSQGTKILADPVSPSVGYSIAPIEGVDAVIVSHEHADHNNVGLAAGSPLVLRGLSSTGWNNIDQKVKDVHIFSISPAIPIYHDDQQGAQRGRNTIFVIEVDGLRIAHFGDLGHTLTAEMVQALGPLDVVLVPVGGSFTIDAAGATRVIASLNPKLAVPMHYKTPKMQANWPGTGVEPFLEGKKVERPNSSIIKLSRATLPAPTTVVVLNYE